MPAVFNLVDQEANFITATDYANREYEKWYNSFLTHATGTAYEGVAADRVDEIISAITQGRNNTFPFYYEDMLGWGENVSTRSYTVQGASQTEYALDSQHDITTLSNRAVYVYLNDTQLLLGIDYTFSTTDDSVNISRALAEGDKIVIKDYADTTGSYMPPSPTALGMYPKFTPATFTDTTYLTDTAVIRKHDGSIIKAYGDERDDLIIELEKRIYNNIKVTYDSSLSSFISDWDFVKFKPLSDRRDDVLPILDFYLNEKSGGNLNFKFSSKALTKLQMYDWPGNISQLINYVEKSLILNQDQNIKELEVDDLALQMGDETASNSSNNSLDLSLKEARSEFEKNYLISQIKRFNGNITKVSEFTGMERTALYRKFKSLDIKVE